MNALIVIPQSNEPARRLDPKKAARRAWDVAAAGYGKAKQVVRKGRKAIADTKKSIDARVSKVTGVEFEWCDAAGTVVGAGVAFRYRCGIGEAVASRVHDRGHWKVFEAVNKAMDSVSGKNHRLKWGHSIECLPALVRECGWVAVPGYAVHLAQDFTTKDGIPLVPFSWLAKIALRRLGFRAATATARVSLSLAGVIGYVGVALIFVEAGGVLYAIYAKAQDSRTGTILCLEGAAGVHSGGVRHG